MCISMTLKRPIDASCTVDKDEESPRCRKRQRQSTRAVMFAPNPTTIEFEKLDEEAKADVWYSQNDFQLFQFERILNVQCLQRVVAGDKTPIDPEVVCFRGLEPYRSEQRRMKFLHGRKSHVAMILEEQDRQRAEDIEEPEAFLDLVAAASHNSLKIVQYQALIDQHEAGLKKIAQKNKVQTITNTPRDESPVHAPTQQTIAIRAA